jgi:hypothetical protein
MLQTNAYLARKFDDAHVPYGHRVDTRLDRGEPAALGPVELRGKLVAHISGSRCLLQPDTLTRRQVALERRA